MSSRPIVRCTARAPVLLLLLLGLLLAPTATADARRDKKEDDPVKAAIESWRRVARSSGLESRLKAMDALLATRDVRALEEALDAYGADSRHAHVLRELIAPKIAEFYAVPKHDEIFLTAFNKQLKAPQHAWLVYQVLRAWAQDSRGLDIHAVLPRLEKRPHHHAAALYALATDKDDEHLTLALQLLVKPPRKKLERALRIESAAGVIEGSAGSRNDELTEKALVRLIELIDEKKTHARTKMVIGRTLARLLGSDIVYLNGEPWKRMLRVAQEREVMGEDEHYGGTPARQPTFMGIQAAGRDIVYVIDQSLSMQEEISGEAKKRIQKPETPRRRGPITGEDEDERKEREAKEARKRETDKARKKQDPFGGLGDIPWERINTRFDAVREALKASLRALQPDQRFAVVVFNNQATLLSATTSMVKAVPKNIERACRALDGLAPTGGTNIHRALEMGFGVTGDGYEDKHAYVGSDHLLTGADTIFFLTDGAPSTDSYSRDGGGNPIPHAIFRDAQTLRSTVTRLNLFRRCEIHCVGFGGGGGLDILRMFTQVGNGRYKGIGE